jgi:shikimate kinase
MGVGKTTLGKSLAKELNATFIDIDSAIEQAENKTISEIFAIHGETYFRSLEASFVNSISEKYNIYEERFVFSTGGGLPCYSNLMETLNQLGITIYLKCSPEIIAQRLHNETLNRPLLVGKTQRELIIYVENQINKRSKYYNKAIFELDTSYLSTQNSVKKILIFVQT